MNIDIRPISREEFPEFLSVMSHAFGWDFKEEEEERWAADFEFDRSVCAFSDGQLVGTGGAISFELTLPGLTQVPTAGVTAVSVLPSHRRQGVLRAMMEHQLSDVRDRGEPLAALWASESIIYGRFGYGMAVGNASWKIDHGRTALGHSTDPSGDVRLVDVDEAKKLFPDVFDHLRQSYPGMLSMPPDHWEWIWWDPEFRRDGSSANRYAVYEEKGTALGAVRYRVDSKWEDGFGQATVTVAQLLPLTLQAYEGLWRHCFGIDLVSQIKARLRPSDEPLQWMLADPRRLQMRTQDGIWLRILDIPAALSARRYSQPASIVLEVSDQLMPEIGGTFRLEGGPDGAECGPTESEPDLRLDVQSLAAIFLGANHLAGLHHSGLIRGEPAAVRTADAMFRGDREPWCSVMF